MSTDIRTPTAVWRCTADLVRALGDRLGDPHDSYVNGSQVWLRETGPETGAVTLEWRLHPVATYERPPGVGTYDVFDHALDDPGAAPALWGGLEVFPAYDDPITVAELLRRAIEVIGIDPDAAGLVDHDVIADAWEQTQGKRSVVDDLIAQLTTQ